MKKIILLMIVFGNSLLFSEDAPKFYVVGQDKWGFNIDASGQTCPYCKKDVPHGHIYVNKEKDREKARGMWGSAR
ncbi:MAG: hypothetical protein FGM41_04960 [Bacteroidetes bacterium]|nr:hypothetical protein [Bacteroidota bacterium]